MKRLFLLALAPAFVLGGLSTRVVRDGAGELTLSWSVNDSMARDSSGRIVLPGALSDASGVPFYTVTVSLPPGASNLRLESAPAGVPCRLTVSGYIRKVYTASCALYPLSGSSEATVLTRQGTLTFRYALPLARSAQSGTAADNPGAEDFFRALLANYPGSLERRLATTAPLARAASPAAPAGARLKFFTSADGVYAVDFALLESFGLAPAAVDPQNFHLYDARGEVPVYVQTSLSGRFGPGDRILFFGTFEKGKNGRYYPDQTISKAWYLGWDSRPGLRAPLVSAAPKYVDSSGVVRLFDPTLYSADDRRVRSITRFRRRVHLEQDRLIIRQKSPAQTLSSSADPSDFEYAVDDYWFWEKACAGQITDVPFSLDAAPAPQGTARFRVGLMGQSDRLHRVTLLVNGYPLRLANGDSVLSWTGQAAATFESAESPLYASVLLGGANKLQVSRDLEDCLLLNWIEADYDALPGAPAGEALITLDTSDIRTLTAIRLSLSGLSGIPEIWDPAGRRFTGFSPSGGGLDLYDAVSGPISYFVAPAVRVVERPALPVNSDLRNPQNGADLLILTPASCLSALDEFIAFKRSRGLKVFAAPVEAVYDQFGDGSVDPEALKSFVQYAYRNFNPPPFYLLIAGDTYEGSDKKDPARNLVPTFYSQVTGWGIVSADTRFTTVEGDDLLPDLSVGRVPGRNPAELAATLRKIIRAEQAPASGAWRNEALLIGGFESNFTEANDRFQDQLLSPSLHVRRVDADTGSQNCFFSYNPSEVRDAFNRGLLFANFYGHGGGSVWSDGFPSIMDHEAALGLTNASGLPVVFSLTCLTASFEADDLWPPLGETMLLNPGGGCAAFYGASGHSFTNADYQLGWILLGNAASGRHRRVGDLLFHAEQSLLGAYGADYFPVAAQYNLLGDPSFVIPYPAPLFVSALDPALRPGDTLRLRVRSDSIASGTALIRIYDHGALSFSLQAAFTGPLDTLAVPFKSGYSLPGGTVRVILWNSTREEAGQTEFTLGGLSALTTRAFLTGAPADSATALRPRLGDSLGFEARLLVPAGWALDTVYVAWAADTSFIENDTFPDLIPLTLRPDTADTLSRRYVSAFPMFIDPARFNTIRGLTWCLTVRFRTPDDVRHLFRRFFHIEVQASPDLAFTRTAKLSVVRNNRPVLRARFVNQGESESPAFFISRILNDTLPEERPTAGPLAGLAGDSLDFQMELQGFVKAECRLDNQSAVTEGNENNNFARAWFGITGGTFGSHDSLLQAPYGGVQVRAARATDTFGLTLFMDGIDSLSASGLPVFSSPAEFPLLPLQAFYCPKGAPDIGRYDFTLLADSLLPDSTVTVRYRTRSALAKSAGSAAFHPGFYVFDAQLGRWRFIEAAVNAVDSSVTLLTRPGLRLAPGVKIDFEGPSISASVRGRPLNARDYIPLRTAIDLTLQDGSAVDTGSVRVFTSGRVPLDRSRYSLGYAGGTGNAVVSFRPDRTGADSLYVTAADVNGNRSDTAKIVFDLGSDLSVRFFANHPNPFGRKTIFAFSLTDVADVEIRIYSLSGRPVRTLALKDAIGYNEIPWDATDGRGGAIANGAYYVKLTVANRSRTIEKIYKIAKAEGR